MSSVDPAQGPDFVQSLVRGLSVIRAFDADHPRLTLSEVARSAGLPRAAARRSLLTLVHLGYVGFADGLFTLRPRVLELGYSYLSTMTLPEVAEPHLERLAADLHESSSMSVLDGDDIVYVSRVSTSRVMTISISVGTRFPAYVTSMGRVLLAALPAPALEEYLQRVVLRQLTARTITSRDALREELARVRAQGWARVDQELEEGLHALAAPVRSRDGRAVAAVNLSTHASRSGLASVRRELLPPLLATVARIEADLDAYPSPRREQAVVDA
ncbi:MAG: IclR family transcriptional regulator, pca regulon regulatory protein [Actinomycetota bacterium]|jgi:IclR family pca regulon transcriptional regulator|nr:IclR family transcriptional regulator, pca regulon regulatory protein [Actinomycetota bacterium]MDQ1664642.1 IclR family transcriptional regulator, pca regulon regulatory protein [Actinomycetota bacterium]MDQ1669069.1 IclR family transcriptional regulator, pca regulon regulatory protein [Actinomycetota bacterium]